MWRMRTDRAVAQDNAASAHDAPLPNAVYLLLTEAYHRGCELGLDVTDFRHTTAYYGMNVWSHLCTPAAARALERCRGDMCAERPPRPTPAFNPLSLFATIDSDDNTYGV